MLPAPLVGHGIWAFTTCRVCRSGISKPGPITSAEDIFEITLDGRGCHASRPDRGHEVMVPACALVLELPTIVARRLISISEIRRGPVIADVGRMRDDRGTSDEERSVALLHDSAPVRT